MSDNLSLAQSYAFTLARSLMVSVVLFRGDLGYGAMPSDEFDGDPASVIHEYDPHA